MNRRWQGLVSPSLFVAPVSIAEKYNLIAQGLVFVGVYIGLCMFTSDFVFCRVDLNLH